jgi:hypothetical protein
MIWRLEYRYLHKREKEKTPIDEREISINTLIITAPLEPLFMPRNMKLSDKHLLQS